MKKNYYVTIYKEEALIWKRWSNCEIFIQKHKGKKILKGFYTEKEAKDFIKLHGNNLLMDNPYESDQKMNTTLNKSFRNSIMEIFRNYPEEKRKAYSNILIEFAKTLK